MFASVNHAVVNMEAHVSGQGRVLVFFTEIPRNYFTALLGSSFFPFSMYLFTYLSIIFYLFIIIIF